MGGSTVLAVVPQERYYPNKRLLPNCNLLTERILFFYKANIFWNIFAQYMNS